MADSPASPARLSVDVWLDIACPWCALGERRLTGVVDTLPFSENVDVRFHSFQLDPSAPEQTTMTQAEYLAGRGFDPARMEASHRMLSQAADEMGFSFAHDDVVPANTFTAHRLIQAAEEQGVQAAVVDALFTAYFQHGLNVGDADALKAVVVDAGLDAETADRVLSDSEAHSDDVRADISQAAALGIRGVPFYVIDNRYGLSGLQPKEAFEQALTQVYDELNPAPAPLLTPMGSEDGDACGIDGQNC